MMLTFLSFMTLSYLSLTQVTNITQMGSIQVKQTLYNQTYALTFMQTPFLGYYHIEINEQSQNTLMIIYKQSSPAYYNSTSIVADKIDYNGYELYYNSYELNRTYQHLVIQGNSTGYLTILTTQLNVQYTLSISKSSNLQCANSCSGQGVCLSTGVCYCQLGYVNEDCSTPATLLYSDNQLNFALTQQMSYFYYQAQANTVAQININVKLYVYQCTASQGSIVQVLVPNLIYLPSNMVSNYDAELDDELSFYTKLNLIQNQTVVVRVTLKSYLDIYNNEFNILISTQSSSTNIPVNMIILYVFIGLASLLFILIVIVCIKRYKAVSQNAPHIRAPRFEKVHPLVDFKLIPIIDGSEDIQQDECTICLGKFFVDELVRKTSCQPVPHLFHDLCIRQWLVKHIECPNCRFDLSGKQLGVLKQQA